MGDVVDLMTRAQIAQGGSREYAPLPRRGRVTADVRGGIVSLCKGVRHRGFAGWWRAAGGGDDAWRCGTCHPPVIGDVEWRRPRLSLATGLTS